ncbi:MAG: 50S ribosome-binding GTPase [Acidobacteria bacterium]|nr:50S ribosome-binding GTPase [Acidobacteriota bacterium]
MPANLTPQYLDAEEQYKRAATAEEKRAALEEMYALLPKHKGTEKLQAEIKKKLSQLKKDQESAKGPQRHDPTAIPREGAGRVVLVGPPNAGKSALLRALSSAEPEVAPYAFTTRLPEQGMAPWEDIQVQVLDLPAVSREFMENWVPAVIRTGDLALLVADPSSPGVLEEIEEVETILREHKVWLSRCDGELPRGGIVVRALLVVNKIDLAGPESAQVVGEFFGDRYPVLAVSAEGGDGVGELRAAIVRELNIVRVYTKIPGKPFVKEKPYALRRGSDLMDLCAMVHKDFSEKLSFARIWGTHKYEGQRVNRDYVLEDGDVVELHL